MVRKSLIMFQSIDAAPQPDDGYGNIYTPGPDYTETTPSIPTDTTPEDERNQPETEPWIVTGGDTLLNG